MLQKTKIIPVIIAILLLGSCYKDRGNYAYKGINEVAIKFDKEDYTVLFDKQLVISPQISNNQGNNDADKFTYQWVTIKDDKQEVLGTKRDLTIENVRLNPGNYQVYLYIKDVKTGVQWQNQVKLEVRNKNYEGWLILSEVNGNSRLDMLTLSEGKYTPIYDILKYLGSPLILKGMPKFITVIRNGINGFNVKIYISTSGNGTTSIDPNTFNWTKGNDISNEFYLPPSNLKVDALYYGNRKKYILSDGNIYYKSARVGFSVPSYNRRKASGRKFKASGIAVGGWYDKLAYDATNKEFLKLDRLSRSCNSIMGGYYFSWKTGKDLVYMESNDYTSFGSSIGAATFAILKDATDNSYYLAQIERDYRLYQNYYGKITATDFDKATTYAFSPKYGYLFYAVGSKVYKYDYSRRSTTLIFDKGNSIITLLKFHDFMFGSGRIIEGSPRNNKYSILQNKLIVCSYDPSKPAKSNGTMELYDVPVANGQVTLDKSYTGFGKIKSVSYRER